MSDSPTALRSFTRNTRLSDDELRRIEDQLCNLAAKTCSCGHGRLEIQKDLMAIPTPSLLVMPAVMVLCPGCGLMQMYSSEHLGISQQ